MGISAREQAWFEYAAHLERTPGLVLFEVPAHFLVLSHPTTRAPFIVIPVCPPPWALDDEEQPPAASRRDDIRAEVVEIGWGLRRAAYLVAENAAGYKDRLYQAQIDVIRATGWSPQKKSHLFNRALQLALQEFKP